MAIRLPPLNAVRAFEAAARHLSIMLAAEELHVTAGAVSRQIKTLEETLGFALFIRGHREITLTRQGQDFHRAVTRAFDVLRDATRKATRVNFGCDFDSISWLIPVSCSAWSAEKGSCTRSFLFPYLQGVRPDVARDVALICTFRRGLSEFLTG